MKQEGSRKGGGEGGKGVKGGREGVKEGWSGG